MTADQVKGKGFRGALNYNLQKLEASVAKLLDTSFSSLDLQSVMKEIALVKMLRPNLQKYFYHTSINFPPEENLVDEKMKLIAMEYLDGMGFNQHQYVIFRHFDADHPHLHILVNRIGYDGTVVSDSKDYQRSEQVLRRLEIKHQLVQVISSKQALERAMTKNELEMIKRTDEPSVKMKLQVILKGLVREKITTKQFIAALESKGINVLFNQASTGFVSGISYGYEGMQFKGAHLGNAYKWQAIKTAIGYEQERDRTAIYQGNLRTRAAIAAIRNSTGTATGIHTIGGGTDQPAIDSGGALVRQGTGRLQDSIRNAGQPAKEQVGVVGTPCEAGQLSSANDKAHRGADGKEQQSTHKQVDRQAVPDSHINHSLLGGNHPVDQGALKEFEKVKKKRKKRLRIG